MQEYTVQMSQLLVIKCPILRARQDLSSDLPVKMKQEKHNVGPQDIKSPVNERKNEEPSDDNIKLELFFYLAM